MTVGVQCLSVCCLERSWMSKSRKYGAFWSVPIALGRPNGLKGALIRHLVLVNTRYTARFHRKPHSATVHDTVNRPVLTSVNETVATFLFFTYSIFIPFLSASSRQLPFAVHGQEQPPLRSAAGSRSCSASCSPALSKRSLCCTERARTASGAPR